MSATFIVGYDPGGGGAHGVAALKVAAQGDRWNPVSLKLTTAHSLGGAVDWLEKACQDGRIVAAGIDTLTEWNSGVGGWRPADSWLRKRYLAAAKSVVSPNYLSGSMAVSGAAFLTIFGPRFESDGTMVTEAHPKVCFFALTEARHAWTSDKAGMATWLAKELGVDAATDAFGEKDHCFDAGMALLAALRGVNRDWTLDLHDLPDQENNGRVQFCGPTHFWWPSA